MICGCMADSPGSRLSEVAGVRGGGDCERHSHRQPMQDLVSKTKVVKTKVVKTKVHGLYVTSHYRYYLSLRTRKQSKTIYYGFNRSRDARTHWSLETSSDRRNTLEH